MLTVKGLETCYGQIRAVRGVDLEVKEGEVVTLIGANGAGKTTLLKTISGILRPTGGTIEYRGKAIQRLAAHEITAMGLVQVPEGREILTRMTVLENLQMGAYLRKDRGGIRRDLEEVFNRFPALRERQEQLGGTLSGGEQQMLAIGRALMARPTLLMMDEPSLGLAPLLVTEIFRIIEELRRRGITILLVEQNARQALKTADRGYVMETGRIVAQGLAKELLQSPDLQQAYLGGTVGE